MGNFSKKIVIDFLYIVFLEILLYSKLILITSQEPEFHPIFSWEPFCASMG